MSLQRPVRRPAEARCGVVYLLRILPLAVPAHLAWSLLLRGGRSFLVVVAPSSWWSLLPHGGSILPHGVSLLPHSVSLMIPLSFRLLLPHGSRSLFLLVTPSLQSLLPLLCGSRLLRTCPRPPQSRQDTKRKLRKVQPAT